MNARMIRVLDQDLWVVTKLGAKDRPSLLLFNGIGANIELAAPFILAMGDVETIIFDMPGVGRSPMPALPYRPSTVARWAGALTRQLGYDKVDVAGVSWGGAIAQEFAHKNRAVCRRPILPATAAGGMMVPGKPSIAAEIYGGAFRLDPSLVNAHAENMKGASNLGYLYQLLAVAGWTSIFWLHTLKQPTLVIMGHDDPIVPPVNGRILTRMIPDARLEFMNCGHLFIVTLPHDPVTTATEPACRVRRYR